MNGLFHVHMWKCAKSWIKVHHTKKDQFLFSFLICYAILSPLFLQNCVLFCCNPQYKLVLLLEKYLFLCKYPRGYFVSKCQDTVKNCLWFLKDNNSNIHFIINYFNNWYTDGKDEYFIIFLLQTNVLLRQSLLSIWAASVTSTISYRATCSSLLRRTKKALRERDDGIVQPLSNHHHENNSIDLFCYKIYMFPHENISKQTGVFSRWILL